MLRAPKSLLAWHLGAPFALPFAFEMASAGAGNSPRTAPGGESPRVERDGDGRWVVVGSFPKETYYIEPNATGGQWDNGMPREGWLTTHDNKFVHQLVKLSSKGDAMVTDLKRFKIQEASGVIHKAGSGSKWAGWEDWPNWQRRAASKTASGGDDQSWWSRGQDDWKSGGWSSGDGWRSSGGDPWDGYRGAKSRSPSRGRGRTPGPGRPVGAAPQAARQPTPRRTTSPPKAAAQAARQPTPRRTASPPKAPAQPATLPDPLKITPPPTPKKSQASPQASPRDSGGASSSGLNPAYNPTPRGQLSNQLRRKEWADDEEEPNNRNPPRDPLWEGAKKDPAMHEFVDLLGDFIPPPQAKQIYTKPGFDSDPIWVGCFEQPPTALQRQSFYNIFGKKPREPSRSPSPRHVPTQSASPQATVTTLEIGEGVEVGFKRPLTSPKMAPEPKRPGIKVPPATINAPPSPVVYKPAPPSPPKPAPPSPPKAASPQALIEQPKPSAAPHCPPPQRPVPRWEPAQTERIEESDSEVPPPPPQAEEVKPPRPPYPHPSMVKEETKPQAEEVKPPRPPYPPPLMVKQTKARPAARPAPPPVPTEPTPTPTPRQPEEAPPAELLAKAKRPVQPLPEPLVPVLTIPQVGVPYDGPQASTGTSTPTSSNTPTAPPQAAINMTNLAVGMPVHQPDPNDAVVPTGSLHLRIQWWAQRNLHFLQPQAMHSVAFLFLRGNFDPIEGTKKCSPIALSDGQFWARIEFAEHYVQQPTATAPPPLPGNYIYRLVGAHGTTTSGAICVLADRRLRRMEHAGVYCQAHNDIKTFEDVKRVLNKALEYTKNVSNVLFEIHAVGETVSVGAGGVPAETQYLREGRCIHNKNAHRWAFPEELVKLRAMWVSNNSCTNVQHVDILEI